MNKMELNVWLARDIDDESAELWLYLEKPVQEEDGFDLPGSSAFRVSSTMFPLIKNGECYEAKLILAKKVPGRRIKPIKIFELTIVRTPDAAQAHQAPDNSEPLRLFFKSLLKAKNFAEKNYGKTFSWDNSVKTIWQSKNLPSTEYRIEKIEVR